MSENHVYNTRYGWLKCEAVGKQQELEEIRKSRKHCELTMESLDKREAVILYTMKKINMELDELNLLLKSPIKETDTSLSKSPQVSTRATSCPEDS